jgi:hypothetical protein
MTSFTVAMATDDVVPLDCLAEHVPGIAPSTTSNTVTSQIQGAAHTQPSDGTMTDQRVGSPHLRLIADACQNHDSVRGCNFPSSRRSSGRDEGEGAAAAGAQ